MDINNVPIVPAAAASKIPARALLIFAMSGREVINDSNLLTRKRGVVFDAGWVVNSRGWVFRVREPVSKCNVWILGGGFKKRANYVELGRGGMRLLIGARILLRVRISRSFGRIRGGYEVLGEKMYCIPRCIV